LSLNSSSSEFEFEREEDGESREKESDEERGRGVYRGVALERLLEGIVLSFPLSFRKSCHVLSYPKYR
jgi:hypothetical protein